MIQVNSIQFYLYNAVYNIQNMVSNTKNVSFSNFSLKNKMQNKFLKVLISSKRCLEQKIILRFLNSSSIDMNASHLYLYSIC